MATHAVDRLAAVPQTLLIPLVARAGARRLHPRFGFADPSAEALVARLESEGVDLDWLRRNHPAVRSLIVRAAWFDRQCADFFQRFPSGTAMSLGVGLDARRVRLAALGVASDIDWHELDLPEVVAIRRAQMGALGARTIAGDALSAEWLDALPAVHGRPLLVVMEGLLMYLPQGAVGALFQRLAARQRALGAPLVLLFDAISRFVARSGKRFSTLRLRRHPMQAAQLFRSGFRGRDDIEAQAAGLHVAQSLDLAIASGGLGGRLLQLRARRWPNHPHYAAWRVELE